MFRHRLGALAVMAALAFPLVASAQTGPAPGVMPAPAAQQSHRQHRHHNRYMHAMRGLNLSAEQKQQIAGIMKSSHGANKTADPQTRRANAQALHQQIESVLTSAQRTQLHANLAQGHRHMKPNGPAPAPAQ